MTDSPINSWDIPRTLLRNRYRRNFCLPNYTPGRWFECDVMELTEAGYLREYEVKVSRGDFRRDSAKGQKHAVLAGTVPHHTITPSRFWFAAPGGLLKIEEIPAWAGLIELRWTEGGWLEEREVKKAPWLHREKAPDWLKEKATSVLYWRLHGLIQANCDAPPQLDRQPVSIAFERLESQRKGK